MSFRFKLVAYFSLLVLVPLLAGFLGVRDVVRQSETRRVDAELVAGLRAAQATYAAALARDATAASTFASNPTFQRALLDHDEATLARLLAPHPGLSLRSGSTRLGPPPLPSARRVEVRSKGKRLGVLLVSLRFDAAELGRIVKESGLAGDQRLASVHAGDAIANDGTHTRVSVPKETPADVDFAGRRMRTVATSLGDGRTSSSSPRGAGSIRPSAISRSAWRSASSDC